MRHLGTNFLIRILERSSSLACVLPVGLLAFDFKDPSHLKICVVMKTDWTLHATISLITCLKAVWKTNLSFIELITAIF